MYSSILLIVTYNQSPRISILKSSSEENSNNANTQENLNYELAVKVT